MNPNTVVGYVYCADIYCKDCILGEVLKGWGIEGHSLSSDVEEALERLATDLHINRDDESTFDSANFPKVYLAEEAAAAEDEAYCGSCTKWFINEHDAEKIRSM